jgi:hypothetical protein
MKLCFNVIALSIAMGTALPTIANAQFFPLSHTGAANPNNEGFATVSYVPNVSTKAVVNDLGVDSWEINSLDTSSQFGYFSGAFTTEQKAGIAANGLSVSFSERVLQGPTPSIYNSTTPYVLSAVGVDTGTRRYQLFLGLDANGDTVAVLPTYIDEGAGNRIRAPGTSYTLTGQGNGYHDYRLVLDPTTQLASLYIDSQVRLEDYAGYTNFVSNLGLGFSGFGGGIARFSNVQLSLNAVPEPTTYAMALAGLLCLPIALKRRSTAKQV